jgi:hypothetical protein
MSVHKIVTAKATTGVVPFTLPKLGTVNGRVEFVMQVDISDTATVEVYGRADPDLSWILITTLTVSSLVPLVNLAEVQISVTATTGTVSASVSN